MVTCTVRLLLLCTLLSTVSPTAESREVHTQLVIETSRTVANAGDDFLCATLDWWPPTKCNFGSCPWREAGIIDLDTENPRFQKALAGLSPLTVRIGGTLQDLVVYDVGDLLPSEPCVPFTRNESALFNFTGGCLHLERWDAINQLFMKTGIHALFGVNVLYGRSKSPLEPQVTGTWDSSNTKKFIQYTRDRGYPVIAWELGNELVGNPVGKSLSPELAAQDAKQLRNIIDDVYQLDPSKPALVAPGAYWDEGSTDIPRFLTDSGKAVVDAITRHIYNLGAGVTETNVLIHNSILNRTNLRVEEERYESLQTVLKEHPETKAWIGEAGGAFNSGHDNVTNAFIMAFWYLDQLGTASRYNNQAFCRQSMVGGYYGLLSLDFKPNPDYYGAYLWRQLMGKEVLTVKVHGGADDIRAYAHCQRSTTPMKGGLTLLVLNYSNQTTYLLNLSLHGPSGFNNITGNDVRLLYHMSAPNGDVTSRTVLLNGNPLLVSSSGDLPTLSPVKVNSTDTVSLAPLTYAFVVLPHADVPACAN